MSDVVQGKKAILEISIGGIYRPIGCAVSCSYTFQNELIAKTDRNAGLFRKKRVRISDFSMSMDGLMTLKNDENISILYMLQEGVRRTEQDVRIRYTDELDLQKQVQGVVLVESISLSGSTDAFVEFSLSMQGTGPITIGAPTGGDGDSPGTGIPGDVQFDWWDTTPGASSITGVGHYGRTFANKDVIEVAREGTQYDEVVSGPSNRQYANSGTVISFDTLNPFNAGERVYVVWQEDES